MDFIVGIGPATQIVESDDAHDEARR